MSNVVIEKSVVVPVWDDITKQKVIIYWKRKRFKFIQTEGSTLLAKRGRWLGNLISADLTYIKSELSVKAVFNSIYCVMEINPRFQMVSEWDLMWWHLEMRTFESFLLHDDEQQDLWRQFKHDHKTVLLKFAFAGGHDKTMLKMPPEARAFYE